MAWVVGGATLMAGVVGVSNIMLITVKERTKEIGVRKALGATPFSIISMVMKESIVLTLIAGLVGVAAGVGLMALADAVLANAAQHAVRAAQRRPRHRARRRRRARRSPARSPASCQPLTPHRSSLSKLCGRSTMKKFLGYLFAIVLVLLIVGAFVFLYKKSQGQADDVSDRDAPRSPTSRRRPSRPARSCRASRSR